MAADVRVRRAMTVFGTSVAVANGLVIGGPGALATAYSGGMSRRDALIVAGLVLVFVVLFVAMLPLAVEFVREAEQFSPDP